MKPDPRWKLYALYPLEGWFGWWKVRMVCMDENAYFMECVTVAKFRSKETCADFIQAVEVSNGYGQLFEKVGGKRTIPSEESGPIWSDQMEGEQSAGKTDGDGKSEKKET